MFFRENSDTNMSLPYHRCEPYLQDLQSVRVGCKMFLQNISKLSGSLFLITLNSCFLVNLSFKQKKKRKGGERNSWMINKGLMVQ